MNRIVPRVATIHDMSCVGRCSLTVILPVLSALKVQVCPLPTAILSSHLGGFKELEICDFTEKMPLFQKHWQKEDIRFDAIYSGFLASEKQNDYVKAFIEDYKQDKPLVLVDPVMGDGGKLYSIYNDKMQNAMRELVCKADIITPNYTEACFLLEEPYTEENYNRAKMQKWLTKLCDFGPEMTVITGVTYGKDKLINIGYNKETNEFIELTSTYIPVRYPGTGDIFASVLLGELLNKADLRTAMDKAAHFVRRCIEVTVKENTPPREGVLFETILTELNPIAKPL